MVTVKKDEAEGFAHWRVEFGTVHPTVSPRVVEKDQFPRSFFLRGLTHERRPTAETGQGVYGP